MNWSGIRPGAGRYRCNVQRYNYRSTHSCASLMRGPFSGRVPSETSDFTAETLIEGSETTCYDGIGRNASRKGTAHQRCTAVRTTVVIPLYIAPITTSTGSYTGPVRYSCSVTLHYCVCNSTAVRQWCMTIRLDRQICDVLDVLIWIMLVWRLLDRSRRVRPTTYDLASGLLLVGHRGNLGAVCRV